MITVDGTFCQAALRGKIHIKDQLPKYIGSSVQLCILLSDHCNKSAGILCATIMWYCRYVADTV